VDPVDSNSDPDPEHSPNKKRRADFLAVVVIGFTQASVSDPDSLIPDRDPGF
jgi:hypothetical protein